MPLCFVCSSLCVAIHLINSIDDTLGAHFEHYFAHDLSPPFTTHFGERWEHVKSILPICMLV